MQHLSLLLLLLQHLQLRSFQKKQIESIVSTIVYRENCVVIDSATEPLVMLSTLLYTPQYLTNTGPPATK